MFVPIEKFLFKTRTLSTSTNHVSQSTKLDRTSSTWNRNISENEIVTDISNNTFLFSEIVGDKTLYFRFSESGCNPCINEQVKFMKLINNSGLYRVVLLVNCSTLRHLQILINSHELSDFEIYKLNNEEEWGAHGESYYFTLDESCLSPENVFVILPGNPEASIDYLKKVLPETRSISFDN